MLDFRFDSFPADARFPGGGVDARFPGAGVDNEHLDGGVDGRFTTSGYGDVAGDPPAAMAAPSVTPISSTSFSFTRAAAPDNGGSPIIRYDGRYRVVGTTSWTTMTGIGATATVSTAQPGAAYQVQTRAVNLVDDNPDNWSPSGTVTLPASIFLTNWTQNTGVEPREFEFDASYLAEGKIVYIDVHDDDAAYPGRGNGLWGYLATTALAAGENIFNFVDVLGIPDGATVALWASIGDVGESDILGGAEFSFAGEEPVVTSPVVSNFTVSGQNGGTNSSTITVPAYNAGDLVVVDIVWSHGSTMGTVTLADPTNGALKGPDNETITLSVPLTHSAGDAGSTGESVMQAWYIAAATKGGTSTLNLSWSGTATAHRCASYKVAGGTFNPTTPIQSAPVYSNSLSSAASAAVTGGTVTVAGALPMVFLGTEVANATAITAGWTFELQSDGGNLSVNVASRDAVATAGESVTGPTITVATDRWSAIFYAINPDVS